LKGRVISLASKDSSDPEISTRNLYGGRGSPALMSLKEPALRLLKARYSETFAITQGAETRVHLFLVKMGLWSLVWTFSPRDFQTNDKRVETVDVLQLIEKSLSGENAKFLEKLDDSVAKATKRIENKVKRYRSSAP
jgi:hypothetical protein